MREIKQKNCKFSLYDAGFEVIAADLDWNASALRNPLSMGLSEEMKDNFHCSNMPDELAVIVVVCSKRDNQIQPRRAENAAMKSRSSGGYIPSPRPPTPLKDPAAAPAGMVRG